MNEIAFAEQELREISPVLAGDAGDQGYFVGHRDDCSFRGPASIQPTNLRSTGIEGILAGPVARKRYERTPVFVINLSALDLEILRRDPTAREGDLLRRRDELALSGLQDPNELRCLE